MQFEEKDGRAFSRCRALSEEFMVKLGNGGLYEGLVKVVRQDKDLHLEFRGQLDLKNPDILPSDEYINIYYKGNNILKLYRNGIFEIDKAFTQGLKMPDSIRTSEDLDFGQ